ncbi:unnamed protein product [Nezara viridula]|uniref:Uncharacterized protein n=1 Tax=Nezara viridula TaxID=85310 RepID=A0A9P0HCK1_NEZVI|nr:unnamed protein product [Nezara viridula]
MAARKVKRDSTSSSSNTRPRDSIIDELPPEETEKRGYVWVVKGTLSDEEERAAAEFGTLPDINSLPIHEISSCTLAKEKVHELIVGDSWREGPPDRRASEDFRLYIPSFIRHMHSLFSRPPEVIRKGSQCVQQILEQMPTPLSDRLSYTESPTRCLSPRPPELNGESSKQPEEPVEEVPSPPEPEVSPPPEPEVSPPPEPEVSPPPEPDRDLNAIYADPEIELEEIPTPPEPVLRSTGEKKRKLRLKIVEERVPDYKPSGKQPYIRDYILNKVQDLENKLKSVHHDISDSKDRQGQLQHQFFEMEILRLVEKISQDETPSETDVAKLEYLTDQLKLVQGKKRTEELQ